MQMFNQSCFIVFLRLTCPQSFLCLCATLPRFPLSHHTPRGEERHREMTGDESVPKVYALRRLRAEKLRSDVETCVFFKTWKLVTHTAKLNVGN